MAEAKPKHGEPHRRSLKLKEWGRNFEPTVRGLGDAPEHLLRTDADGYICTGNAGEPVVILGDSFAECSLVPERLRFCSVVESILRAQGKAVCIKNAGMSGAHMMHHIFTLLAKTIPLHPKLAMDFSVSKYKEAYWSPSKFPSIFTDTIVMNDKLYSQDFDRSKYRLVVQSFIKICKTFLNLKIADQNKIHCIDFRSDLNNCRQDITYDSLHLNAYGSALFGKYLARALLEGHLL